MDGRRAGTRGALRLFACGLGMLLPSLYFARAYPLRGNVRLTDLGHLSRYDRGAFYAFIAGLGAMFVLYALALRETRRLDARRALPIVLGWGAALSAVFAWMYPATAIDVFVHYVYARIFTHHGADPAASQPSLFTSDPLMRYAGGGWADDPSPYGPLWNLVAAPVALVAGEDVGLALAGFKLLAVLCLLGGGVVIGRLLLAARPADAATGVLFYVWNPLVLWEVAGNAHNDALMALLLLVAFAAWEARWDRWVLPLLVAAALTKYAAGLLVPVAAVALLARAGGWRERAQLLAWSGGWSLAVAAVAFFPFYDLAALRESVESTSRLFLVSPANMLIGILSEPETRPRFEDWARRIGGGILLLTLAVAAFAVWRRPARLPRASFEVLYVFLLVVTWYFQGWYLVWPLAVAALLPWGWPAWRMIAWTVGAMASYALFIWLRQWWHPPYSLLRAGVPLIYGASALLTLAELALWVRRRWGE